MARTLRLDTVERQHLFRLAEARHPLYPRLEMTSASFAVQAAPGTRMVVYTPADAAPARP